MGSNSSKKTNKEASQLQTKNMYATTDSTDCVPVANIDPMGPPLGPVEKFIALYDCESRTEEDLSLAKGDGIIIVDNQDNRRWKARCVSSGKEGYISSNYVAPLESIRSRKLKQEASRQQTRNMFATETDRPVEKFIALYDYESRTEEDLSLTKGDKTIIVDNQDNRWWKARCVSSGREGYIPSNYVAPMKSIRSREWFFGQITRSDAEKKLISQENPQGTFLVRNSPKLRDTYMISIRHQDSVEHYKIKRLYTGGFFITMKRTFATLDELVTHYTMDADGLCARLSNILPNKSPQTMGLSNMQKDLLEIDRSHLGLTKKLGAGLFGEVWEGVCYNCLKVAIKTLRPGIMQREDFLAEAAIIRSLHHENLIQLYAVCTLEEPIYIVTEYMHRGSLLDYLQKGDGCKLVESELINIGAQVASGMAYLELHRYIHGLLAAKNVLVGENGQMKVADLGLARVVGQDIYEDKTGYKFPIKWTAPEAALYNKFTIKSDVWSFGIVLMEIITLGCIPYPGMTNAQVLAEVPSPRNYRMSKPPNTPDLLYQIMLDCWNMNADCRLTFEYLEYRLKDFYAKSGRFYGWGKYPG